MMFDVQPVSGPEAYAETQFSRPMAAFVRTASSVGLQRRNLLKTYLVTGEEARAMAEAEAEAEAEAKKARDPDKDLPTVLPAPEYIAYRLLREAKEKYGLAVSQPMYQQLVGKYSSAFAVTVAKGSCLDHRISHSFNMGEAGKVLTETAVKVCRQSESAQGAEFIIPDRVKYFNMQSILLPVPGGAPAENGIMRVPLRNYVPITKSWSI